MSCLHRGKDPVGQAARWIEVIETYDIMFQHRPRLKHGNADTLSQYLCKQCEGRCGEDALVGVRVLKRSHMYGMDPGGARRQPGS